MVIERVPGTSLTWHLLAYDDGGHERLDAPGGRASEHVLETLRKEPVSDVFVFSHGWIGDIPAARAQYNRWIQVMAACTADVARAPRTRPGFRPLLIGLHWNSLPWSDEELATPVSFSVNPTAAESLVERYARRLSDTPMARAALHEIAAAATVNPAPRELPSSVRVAYEALNAEAGSGQAGPGAPPGADRDPFDPELLYQQIQAEALNCGTIGMADLLAPLRQLSFWKMKERARQVGEAEVHDLVRTLLGTSPAVRLHLMGHSFGCIVASAAVAGPPGGPGLPRPVQSLALVQGALSLWSYCVDIPPTPGRPGYFHPLVARKLVAGPIIATQSENDTAVGRWYPLGAGAARQISFGVFDLPRYGGVGTFGVRGPGLDIVDLRLASTDLPCSFQAGRIHNLDASWVIRQGEGASGAHNDIAHQEVAHAIWEAALT